jgi:hypothetical protein
MISTDEDCIGAMSFQIRGYPGFEERRKGISLLLSFSALT